MFAFFFFKQKTAYEMRISDWSSDVCSSDLEIPAAEPKPIPSQTLPLKGRASKARGTDAMKTTMQTADQLNLDWSNNPRWNGVTRSYCADDVVRLRGTVHVEHSLARSEEHTSELQSLMRISYAAFCLQKNK